MDLSDADELDIYDVSPAYGMCVMGVTQEDIDDAPTVEAIPISWLEDFRDGLDTLSENRLIRAIDLIIDAYRAEKKREEE